MRYDVLQAPFYVLKHEIFAPQGRLCEDGAALATAFGIGPSGIGRLSDHLLRQARTSVFTVPPRCLDDEPTEILQADIPYTGPNGRSGEIRTTWRPVLWGPTSTIKLQLVSASPRTA